MFPSPYAKRSRAQSPERESETEPKRVKFIPQKSSDPGNPSGLSRLDISEHEEKIALGLMRSDDIMLQSGGRAFFPFSDFPLANAMASAELKVACGGDRFYE